jgi:hypothetical protein
MLQEKELMKQLAAHLKAPAQILGDDVSKPIDLQSAGTAPVVCEADRECGSGTQPGDRPLDALEAVQPTAHKGERPGEDTARGMPASRARKFVRHAHRYLPEART